MIAGLGRIWLIGLAHIVGLAVALPAHSLDLSDLTLPGGAVVAGQQQDEQGIFALPSDVFDGQSVPMVPVTGQRIQQAWSVPFVGGVTVFGLFDDLSDQISAQGYDIELKCQAQECGGFSFRRALDLLPPPQMFVDLSDFYALRGDRMEGSDVEAAFLLVSRTDQRITVQITGVGAQMVPKAPTSVTGVPIPSTRPDFPLAEAEAVPDPLGEPKVTDADMETDLATTLDDHGRAVLEDILFASGSSGLDTRPASLQALADYLRSRPNERAVIVGHSDSVGGSSANLALSKQRAMTVRRVLVNDFGVPGAQLSAEGVGPFAPRDNNASQDGRARNRRVEVIVLTP